MGMIAHYYLWTSTREYDALNNTRDANTLYGLAPSQSRLSANSYVYYAASKSFLSFFLSFFLAFFFTTGSKDVFARVPSES